MLGGLGERYQWGLGRNPSRQRFYCFHCSSECLWVCVFVNAVTLKKFVRYNMIMKCLWEHKMVKSSVEIENGCIPMHWQIQGMA